MRWNKDDDTFTLTREELADIMDFLDSHAMEKRKNEIPIGWEEFKKEIYMPLNRLMGKYALDKNTKFEVVKDGKM